MKILYFAFACKPNHGSEPEVGWKTVIELAKLMPNSEITVVTRIENKQSIEIVEHPDNLVFIYSTVPYIKSFDYYEKKFVRTYYYIWMIFAVKKLKKLNLDFDVIHHITYVNDWMPSLAYLLKSKSSKFIWGPIGSNDPIPFKFLSGNKAKVVELLRRSLQFCFRRIDPFFYYCKRNSDVIMGINSNVKRKLSQPKASFITESAIAINCFDFKSNRQEKLSESFTVISIGRLIGIKNFDLTIEAFYEFLKIVDFDSNVSLKIVGDGPEKIRLNRIVKKYKIEEHVVFVGKVSMDRVQEELNSSDVFVFPTLENAGFVILEAMANKLPVIALDYGGPKQFINNNIERQLVSIELNYDEIKKSMASNILNFYENKDLLNEVGKGNLETVSMSYSWESKVHRYKSLYQKLMVQ